MGQRFSDAVTYETHPGSTDPIEIQRPFINYHLQGVIRTSTLELSMTRFGLSTVAIPMRRTP